MVIDRAVALIDLVREHHLLEPAQLEELSRTSDVSDTPAQLLGQCMIELGWLSPYQVDCLLQQRTQDLFLGSYHLLDRLGQGETGPVYQARKPGKAGTVVLKSIPKVRLADPQLLARFQQEARTAAQLQHPNIAPVVAVGQHGNLFLFAREFVPGADLGRMVRELGPLPPFLACNAVRQVALALQCAHDKGLSHRRVKPFNLIVVDRPGTEGTVKLVDFGLGQLTAGASAGLDVATDLAALGQTLSFLLTGQTSPDVAGLPAEVADIVRRLSPDATDRFRAAWEVSHALEALCHEPLPAAALPLNAESMAPAAEPADIPVAAPAFEAVPAEPAAAPVACVFALGATSQAAELAMPLEGIAVPVLGTVGVAVGPEEPSVASPAPIPESPAAVSAEAVPEALAEASPVVQAVVSEPAIAAPPPLAEPVVAGPEPPPLHELAGSGIAGDKPDESDWPLLQSPSEPAQAPAEIAPAAVVEAPPPAPEGKGFGSPFDNAPGPMPPVPFSEPGAAGFFTDQPPSTAVAAEDAGGYPMSAAVETAPRPPVEKKWRKRDIMWIVVGALFWIVAGILAVVIVMVLSNREAPPKNHRPNVPGKMKGKPRAELVPKGVALTSRDR